MNRIIDFIFGFLLGWFFGMALMGFLLLTLDGFMNWLMYHNPFKKYKDKY